MSMPSFDGGTSYDAEQRRRGTDAPYPLERGFGVDKSTPTVLCRLAEWEVVAGEVEAAGRMVVGSADTEPKST